MLTKTFTGGAGDRQPICCQTPLDDLIEAEELDADASGINDIPADALLVLLRFLVPAPRRKAIRNAKRWDIAQIRLIVLAHAAGLEGVADRSFAEIAAELGCTRAKLSLYATRMVDELGQDQVRGCKRRSSRAKYRDSATAYHSRAGHIMAVSPPGGAGSMGRAPAAARP